MYVSDNEFFMLYFFQFYGYLSQQQNMMQDYIRTSTYQRAMLSNVNDFLDKVCAESCSRSNWESVLKTLWQNESVTKTFWSSNVERYQILT